MVKFLLEQYGDGYGVAGSDPDTVRYGDVELRHWARTMSWTFVLLSSLAFSCFGDKVVLVFVVASVMIFVHVNLVLAPTLRLYIKQEFEKLQNLLFCIEFIDHFGSWDI